MSRPGTAPLAGWRRLLRVGVLGSASFALAVCAHLAAGGGGPSWPLTVVAIAVLGAAAVTATRRRRRFGSLLVILALQQVALHVVMSLGDAPAAMCSTPGHGHHDMAMSCVSSGSASLALPDVPMLLAHLLATAVTAWLLARGEAWLWRLLRRAAWLPVPVCVPMRPRLLTPWPSAGGVASPQGRPAAPRGPPSSAALLAG